MAVCYGHLVGSGLGTHWWLCARDIPLVLHWGHPGGIMLSTAQGTVVGAFLVALPRGHHSSTWDTCWAGVMLLLCHRDTTQSQGLRPVSAPATELPPC